MEELELYSWMIPFTLLLLSLFRSFIIPSLLGHAQYAIYPGYNKEKAKTSMGIPKK